MKPFVLPCLLLVALLAIFFHFFFLGKSDKSFHAGKEVISPASSSGLSPERLKDITLRVHKAIDEGNFQEARKILDPVKGENDVLIKTLFMYTKACLGDLPKSSEMNALEKDVTKDRGLEAIFFLSQLFSVSGNKEKAHELLTQLQQVKLPSDLRRRVLLTLADEKTGPNSENAALVSYMAVIKEFPTDEKPFLKVFDILQKLKSQKGLDEVREAGDLYQSKNFGYNFQLGKLLLQKGKPEEAASCFEKSRFLMPKNPDPTYFLVLALERAGNEEGALKEAEKLLEADRVFSKDLKVPEMYFKCALSAKNLKMPNQAFKFFREAILSDRTLLGENDNGTFLFVQNWVHSSGSVEEKLFAEALSSYLVGEPKKTKDFLAAKSGLIKEKKLKRDSERLLNECLRIIDGENAYAEHLVMKRQEEEKATIEKLRQELLRKKMEADLEAPSRISPASVPVILALTGTPTLVIASQMDTNNPRIPAIKEAASANPEDWQPQFAGGFQLASLGDINGAKTLFRRAIRANPNLAEAHLALGKIARFEGNTLEAFESIEKASKLAPNNLKIRCVFAEMLEETGKTSQALSEVEKILKDDSQNNDAKLVRAKIYFKQQKFEDALKDVRFGLSSIDQKKDPETAKSYMELYNQLRAKTQ